MFCIKIAAQAAIFYFCGESKATGAKCFVLKLRPKPQFFISAPKAKRQEQYINKGGLFRLQDKALRVLSFFMGTNVGF